MVTTAVATTKTHRRQSITMGMEDLSTSMSSTDDKRLLQANPGACTQVVSLQTPFEADTTVYGTMFTAQSQEDAITVLAMEISANPTGEDLGVEIYTKLGGFQGAETNDNQWTKIVDTSVVPSREGRGTLIPTTEFQEFTMQPNELRSFFVTLKSADLRYNRADDMTTGDTFTQDGYLALQVGIGVSNIGFVSNGQIFANRAFNGIFHYTYATDCDKPSSKTLFTYNFHGRPVGQSGTPRQVMNTVATKVHNALSDIISASEEMQSHSASLALSDKVNVTPQSGRCDVWGWDECTAVDITVTISHSSSITTGQVEFFLLEHVAEVTERAQGGLEVAYSGYEPLETNMFVAFKGVPTDQPMDASQQLWLEEATAQYLADETLGLSNAPIIGTKVLQQRGPNFLQPGTRRKLQDEDWIEVLVKVLAKVKPPYSGSSFSEEVSEAFRADRDGYIEDIKAGKYRPGSPVQGDRGDFFLGIEKATTRIPEEGESMTPTNSSGSDKILGMSQTVFIIVCLSSILATLIWIWWFFCRGGNNEETVPLHPREAAPVARQARQQRQKRGSVKKGAQQKGVSPKRASQKVQQSPKAVRQGQAPRGGQVRQGPRTQRAREQQQQQQHHRRIQQQAPPPPPPQQHIARLASPRPVPTARSTSQSSNVTMSTEGSRKEQEHLDADLALAMRISKQDARSTSDTASVGEQSQGSRHSARSRGSRHSSNRSGGARSVQRQDLETPVNPTSSQRGEEKQKEQDPDLAFALKLQEEEQRKAIRRQQQHDERKQQQHQLQQRLKQQQEKATKPEGHNEAPSAPSNQRKKRMDPDLALALKLSRQVEEEHKKATARSAEESKEEVKAPEQQPAVPVATAGAGNNRGKEVRKKKMDPDLALALKLSRQEEEERKMKAEESKEEEKAPEQQSSVPATAAANQPSGEDETGMDADFAMALKIQQQEDQKARRSRRAHAMKKRSSVRRAKGEQDGPSPPS